MAMALPSPTQRTLFLHIGMHKTASTYIQRRLRKNRSLLRKNGVLLPAHRQKDNKLLKALSQESWKPWGRWLKRAEIRGCNLLVSHEALSCSLYQSCSDGETPRGLWLADQLRRCGWKLKVVGFIRDQESYLNSRYTQLVKRLAIRSDFTSYVAKVMEGNTISECDLITLFGWLIEMPSVEKIMIPFGASKHKNGLKNQRQDPFQQLADEIGLSAAVIRQCKPVSSINQQPGRLGVALALEISRFLKQHHPEALARHSKQLRGGIERMAKKKGWPAEPFNGLDSTIQQAIRIRYQSSNAEFCRCFWPEMTWDELFTSRPKSNSETSNTVRTQAADAELKACRGKVIASTLPNAIAVQIPG